MKTAQFKRLGPPPGFILIVVLVLMSVSVFIMAGAMKWTSGSANITERNVYYQRTVAAAEGATEGVIARMVRDFENGAISGSHASFASHNRPTPFRHSPVFSASAAASE